MVREQLWIVDPATGDLVVEGLEAEESLALAGDLLPKPMDLNCARPLRVASLPVGASHARPMLRIAAIWHGSLVEGPGRRPVVQVQGCPIRCGEFIYSTDAPIPPLNRGIAIGRTAFCLTSDDGGWRERQVCAALAGTTCPSKHSVRLL